MSQAPLPLLPILTGPTGSGKSSLALRVAERLGLEILNADSRQLFRGLEVATAAPDADMLRRVPHHLVGSHDPLDTVSAGDFCRSCRELIAHGPPRSPAFLMSGGSVFYIRAFIDPVEERVSPAPELRAQVLEWLESEGPDALRARLLALDPEASWISVNDVSKLRRHLEICLATGLPASQALQSLRRPATVRPLLFVLDTPLEALTGRLHRRLKAMLAGGMIEEVEALLKAGVPETSQALSSVGVQDIRDFLEGRIGRDTLEERVYRNTRRYARKQLTWFKALGREGRTRSLDHKQDEETLCRTICDTLEAARD